MSASFRIVHISDPHFGTTTTEKIALLSKTIRELNPNVVALSGDITQRARRDQFLAARSFCDSLTNIPIMAVPGNHDIPLYNMPARLFYPYFGFRRYLKFPLNERRSFGDIELLGLNSTGRFRIIQGELHRRELSKLTEFSSAAKFRIVMCHHPMDCPKGTDEKNILKCVVDDLPRFEEAKVDLVLSGHIHDPMARLSSIRYKDTRRPMPIVLAGTCLSSRTRSDAPNSFNLIEVSLKGEDVDLDVTRYDLMTQKNYLPLTDTQFLRRGRDHWITKVKNESLTSPHTSDKIDRQ